MRTKLILIAIIGILITLCCFSIKSCNNQQKEKKQWENNAIALSSEIETYKDKNGDLVSKAQGLELKISDLSLLNADLYKDIAAMQIKLKNATSVIQIKTEYKYVNKDSLIYVKLNDSIRSLKINEPYLKLNMNILHDSLVLPNNLSIFIPNKQTIITEIKTKGWWIFRRKDGVQIHIKNSNPYIQTDSIFYVKLINKREND